MKRTVCLLLAATLLLAACAKPAPPAPTPAPTPSLAELLLEAERLLSAGEYEEAILAYEAVIRIEPKDPRGYTGTAEAYVGLGRPEMAIDALEKGQAAAGEDAGIQGMLNEIHRAEEERLQAEEKARTDAEVKSGLDELLALYETDGYESILEQMESGAFQEIFDKITEYPILLLNETEDHGIGVYEDGWLYIGGYADGQRSGQALWLGILGDEYNYRYEGAWENDLPNGSGTVFTDIGPRVLSGTLINGIFDGSVTETLDDGTVFPIDFVNGKVIITGEPREGDDGVLRWPTSYDSYTGNPSWFWPESRLNALHGVLPFAENS